MINIAAIDAAGPVIHGRPVSEQDLTQFSTYWASDLLMIKSLGFDIVRLGIPIYQVWTARNTFNWQLVDALIQFCDDLGLTPWYALTHFSYPAWLGDEPLKNPDLKYYLCEFAVKMMARYPSIQVYSPFIEISTDIACRYQYGHWYPHAHDTEQAELNRLADKLYTDWQTVSDVIRLAGYETMLVECAPSLWALQGRQIQADWYGLNYYPQKEQEPLDNWLDRWMFQFPGKRLAITEYDICGSVQQRLEHIEQSLAPLLRKYNHVLGAFNWYPTLDNRAWASCLTQGEDSPLRGDNAGLVDFRADHWGRLHRIPRPELAEALKKAIQSAQLEQAA